MEESKINEEIYSVEDARMHIEKIHNQYTASEREYVLSSLAGATQSLELAFPGTGHFLMEYIQNSDDAHSNSMEIIVTEKAVIIRNDGATFSKSDVDSICKVGKSSKTPTDSIGYLGVGFKAGFLISDSAQVYSGYYGFKFDKSFWQVDSDNIPWQVIPINDFSYTQNEMWKTEFILNYSDKIGEEQIRALESEISPENLSNRVLLFLNYLKNITILNGMTGTIRKITKSNKLKTTDYEIYSIEEHENDRLVSADSWLVFRQKIKVREDMCKHSTTPNNRKNILEREVLVSFRLDHEDNLIVEEGGTAHMGVFSFLPLKDFESGLNFLVQSDFLTATGRADIIRESPWNKGITEEIYNLIIEKCVPIFLSNHKWKLNFTTILYSSGVSHPLFKQYLIEPLNSYLRENDVLIDSNGEKSKPCELIELNSELQELLSDADIEQLYPKFKKIHPECKPHDGLHVTKGAATIGKLFACEIHALLDSKAKENVTAWFVKLYSMLAEKYKLQYFDSKPRNTVLLFEKFWDEMIKCNKKIILTDNFELAKISECHTNIAKTKIPNDLKEYFKIVHPEIAESEGFKSFRERLITRYKSNELEILMELTEEDILNKYYLVKLSEMNEDKWANLSEIEKVSELKNIKECYCFYMRDNKSFGSNLSYLTVPSKRGTWLKPRELIFGNDYKSGEHNLEVLIEKGIYDLDDIDFISAEFIEGITKGTKEMNEWIAFFEHLGVGAILENPNEGGILAKIIGRIGIVTALRYEASEKRNTEIQDESVQDGFDIKSGIQLDFSEGVDRYIEVKATKDSESENSPSLKGNQAKALQKYRKKFYLYRVTDALKRPVLSVINGSKLLKIMLDGAQTTFKNKDLSQYVDVKFDVLEHV